MIGEILDVLRVHMAVVGFGNDALGIVLVFDFHASEATNVNVGTEVAACSDTFSNTHVHIESSVSFLLAIRNAGLLLSGLNLAKLSLNAVLVALIEKEGREGGGHPGLSLILGVLCPIRHFYILLTIINSTFR